MTSDEAERIDLERSWRTTSPDETQSLAEALGRSGRPGDVVLLVGPLGAGKTCFVQGLARGLEVTIPVKSPTFVLLSRHPGRVPLSHLDLYRVEGERDLDELGLEERLEDSLLAVEWGEKLEHRLDDGLRVDIEEVEEETPQARLLRARPLGGRGADWLAAWTKAAHEVTR